MSPPRSKAPEIDLPKEIRFLLLRLTDWAAVARSSKLLQLPEVTRRLRPFLRDSPENRALILQEMVDEILSKKLAEARDSANWRRSGEWEALQLRFVNNVSEAEIADRLRVSPSTVKRYVRTGTNLICSEFNKRFLIAPKRSRRQR